MVTAGPEQKLPKIWLTLGDVAGIGPEIIVKAWPKLVELAEPLVVGEPDWIERAVTATEAPLELVSATTQPNIQQMPVLKLATADLSQVQPGAVSAAAGRAAYDFLACAIDACLEGRADAVVTCPLHKEGLHLAGIAHPGHTEILAERTGAKSHAMLLYDDELPLAVAHVTLHARLANVFPGITCDSVLEKIRLLNGLLPQLTGRSPRIGVAALNPHASDGGLFGHEEAEILEPAVRTAVAEGIDAVGPIPADAIFLPKHRQQLDGIVAMYHDQGHIAMKLLGGRRAINITAGLPIIRTSVAHGTAYDIAGQGIADPSSLIAAVRVAARLARSRTGNN